jgi:hypothetical protein
VITVLHSPDELEEGKVQECSEHRRPPVIVALAGRLDHFILTPTPTMEKVT